MDRRRKEGREKHSRTVNRRGRKKKGGGVTGVIHFNVLFN